MLRNKTDDLRKCEDFDSIRKLHNKSAFHKSSLPATYPLRACGVTEAQSGGFSKASGKG